MRLWYDQAGFPVDHPKLLMDAVRRLPGGASLTETKIRYMADILDAADADGRDAELPRNRPASGGASDSELIKFHDYCEKLADHIESLRAPATDALLRQGLLVLDLVPRLREAQEIARCAFSDIEAEHAGGRPRKAKAALVTEASAAIFQEVSGKRPTYTTDPATGGVSGVWPDFLRAIFAALYIDASVASQVRAWSEKTP